MPSHSETATVETAEKLRWAISRLSSRLRAEQPDSAGQGLTRLAVSVMANLRHSGPMTPTELAAVEGLRVQSLTRVLNEQLRRGRIARTSSSQDRRRRHLTLTDVGRTALREHVRDGNAWLATSLEKHLTPAERHVLDIAAGLLQQVASEPPGPSASASSPSPRGATPPL